MKKCVLGMLLPTAFMAAVLTGCTNAAQDNGSVSEGENDQPYEATLMYLVANDARDVDSVETALNELTMSELNIKVTLQPMTVGTYSQQIQMILSSDDKLDILPIMGNSDTFIEAEYLLDLNPYLDEYGQGIVEQVGMEDLMCCAKGDMLWGVPTMHERTNPMGIIMRTDLLEESGYTAEDIKTWSDLTKVYEKVNELHPEMTMLGGHKTTTPVSLCSRGDALGGGNFGVLGNNGQDTTITNYYESSEFKEMVELMHEWYEKGFVASDFATCTDMGETLMKAGNLFSFTGMLKPNSKVEKDSMTGYDTTIIAFEPDLCTTTTTNALAYGISSGSENPEKAMELLNWIYTSPDCENLLNWGIEGKDYVVLEDGTIDYPEGVTAENVGYHQDYGWALPNQYIAKVWTGNSPSVWDEYKEVRENSMVSKAYGFCFDTAPVINEVTALTAVEQEYLYTIGSGSVDPESSIAEFNQKLYDNGLSDVMKEKQAQLDEWLASRE